MFGTPSGGIPERGLKQTDYEDLSEAGDYIKNLRSRWQKEFEASYPFYFKTVAATKDEFVPVASSLEVFENEYREFVEGDHFSMVAVEDQNNDTYSLIINALTGNKFFNQFSSSEEINLALGEYDEVIKKLLPKQEQLDKKGLVQLIFALEGVDRAGEGLKILHDHPLAKDNSDLFGVIGGRYKRKFLENFSEEDGQASYEYYLKGLKLAEAKNDFNQIYYLAINLAFLSVVLKEDAMGRQEFSQKALEATEKDLFDSLWKLATIAEANLYLGKFEESKSYYAKAASMCGLREKISIYTNAYHAYKNLMHTDSQEDSFLKFLKNNFLT